MSHEDWLDLAVEMVRRLLEVECAAAVITSEKASGRSRSLLLVRQLTRARAIPRSVIREVMRRLAEPVGGPPQERRDWSSVSVDGTKLATARLAIDGAWGCLVALRRGGCDFTLMEVGALQHVADTVAWLADRHAQARAADRHSFGRILHGRVAEALTCLMFTAGELEAAVAADEKPLARSTRLQAAEVVRQMRRTVSDLVGDGDGKGARDLSGLLRDLGRYGLQVHTSGDLSLESFPDGLATCLYEVAREAIVNVRRHAGATRLDLALRHDAGGVKLLVADNGNGCPPDRAWRARGEGEGSGLRLMRERIEEAGGTLWLEGAPAGRGTRVTVWLPCTCHGKNDSDTEERRKSSSRRRHRG